MKDKFLLSISIITISSFMFLCFFNLSSAQKKIFDPLTIVIEGSRLPPVEFSHKTHTGKLNIDCTTCHHKDKNPKEPQHCLKCHPAKKAEENRTTAKKAFHKLCITCHREKSAKNITAPTKCNECHQK